ncbi:hypothetical protein COP2_008324 [Malus domestica]
MLQRLGARGTGQARATGPAAIASPIARGPCDARLTSGRHQPSSHLQRLRSPSKLPGSRNAILIRKPGPVNSHNFFHEKGGTVVDSSSTASSKIRIFSRASNATSSSASHVDDDNDRDCGCSRQLALSSFALSRSFDDSSSCSHN